MKGTSHYIMNEKDYLLGILSYTDINGFVKPRKDWVNSGNGITYTAYDMLVRKYFNYTQRVDFKSLVMRCFTQDNLLKRTPDNQFGNQQHDDIQQALLGSVIIKDTEIPRRILKGFIGHFGVYNTDGKKESKDLLFRFAYLIPSMIAAAFPKVGAFLMYPFLKLHTKYFKPKKNDISGVLLQWAFHGYMYALYGNSPYYLEWMTKMYTEFNHPFPIGKSFGEYLDKNHPIAQANIYS